MKRYLCYVAICLLLTGAAARAALPEEKTLLALGRGETQGLGLKLSADEAGQAAKGLLDYLTIKDNCPSHAESFKVHELIAARQDAASGQAADGQGTPDEWKNALYAYGQEAGARLYEAALSKEEAAVVAGSFEQALRGEAAPGKGGDGAGILAFMAARRAASLKGQQAFFDKMTREPGAVKTASGFLFIPRKEGEGPAPKPFYWVKFSGQSRLWDGKLESVVDAAEEMQLSPADFITDALLKMKTGGKATLVRPPGFAGSGAPAMYLDMELLSVREGKEPEPGQQAAEVLGEQEYKAYVAELEKKDHYKVKIAEYEKGDHAQAYSIGIAYFHGVSGAPHDYQKAGEWYLKAAEKGNPLAYLRLGDMSAYGYGMAANETAAYKWYRKAAEKGNAEGQEKMGDIYYYGTTVKKDRAAAAKWYSLADSADANYRLGRMYMKGEGVEQDYPTALKHLLKAAESGNYTACVFIASIFSSGEEGVKRDPAKAVEWLRKGAVAGNTLAMNDLAEAYAAGDLVERDYTEAYRWLAVVTAKSNDVTAENLMSSISKKMSQSEMASARAKAAESVEKYVTEKDREFKEYAKTLELR
ncbi:MAG TPA: hypothetical protein DDW67_01120 [Elusimicrobia bacterium]|nr:hypothetical protein [Elusimicrobiota bacterium]